MTKTLVTHKPPPVMSGALVASTLIFPWLNPFTNGPSSAVMPWLVSAICVIITWPFRSRLTVFTAAGSWLVAALVSAAMGLLQYFGQTQSLTPWVFTTPLGEAFANLRQRNQFATLTSIGLLALLWFAARRPTLPLRSGLCSRWVFLWLACAAVLLALGNAASGSRTGLFQWLLVFGLVLMWSARGQRRVIAVAAFALTAYGVAVLVLPWTLQAMTGMTSSGLLGRFEDDAGCASRRVLWSNVLHLITQKPWGGWGWGELDYAHFVTLYPAERFCDILDNAHNLPLHLAVELGVPVAATFCALAGWLVWRNKPWAEADPTRQLAWGVLAVIGLHSLLEYPLWYGPFQLATGLSIWMLWQPRPDSTGLVPKWPLAPVIHRFIATFAIAMCAFVAWDYWRISQLYLLPADRAASLRTQTYDKVQGSWLFQDQVQFAALTTTPLTASNASAHYAMALRLLHFSPEPRVVEAAIESAVMLGKDEDALYYLQRYKAAFPDAHAQWAARSERFKAP